MVTSLFWTKMHRMVGMVPCPAENFWKKIVTVKLIIYYSKVTFSRQTPVN